MGSLDIEASLPTCLRHHALLPQLAVGDNRGMVRRAFLFRDSLGASPSLASIAIREPCQRYDDATKTKRKRNEALRYSSPARFFLRRCWYSWMSR